MTRTRIFLLLLIVTVIAFSCKEDTKKKLIGTWKVVKWENPYTDSFFLKAQAYIDTIGKGHTDAENIAIYGAANVDSMRHMLQAQYDSAKAIQDAEVTKTIFKFEKDGQAEVTLDGKVNKGKWLLDDENGLILEEAGFGNPADISKYNLIAISDKELKLRFYQEQDSSTVTFTRIAP